MASHPATVTEIEQLAPQILQLTVSVDDAKFRFHPGQWVNFRFPEGVSRAYTIASPPQKPESVQLCIRVGAGQGGEALQKLETGAPVSIDGPYGDFQLPDNDSRDVVFLAGDTGIAPVRSIVLHMLATHDRRKIVVLYEPDQRHILYAADFDPLARSGQIVHMSGAIETLISRNRKAVSDSIIMAAGFDSFLERARASLKGIGVDPSTMIKESFGPMP
ncbi:MAG TPA: FAD-dependent oxidoreductase [Thermoanaerobaculia bacterium]|jgi:ferredoxin-NADP reductase|nr:FAD-dependent oxidoreductase [Thermoanaerobaculia bacterium]